MFGYLVRDPKRYGIIELDEQRNVLSIKELPQTPKSNHAIVGLFFYDKSLVELAKSLEPSLRGEIEITVLNNLNLQQGYLSVKLRNCGYAWLDTGTHDSLVDATVYVKTIEERQGRSIACIKEIAYTMGYIDKDDLCDLAEPLDKSSYGRFLRLLIGK